jgi:hypothetical protein
VWYSNTMDKSSCFVNQLVHATVPGKGRGGHSSLRGIVLKVNRKTAEVEEVKGSYAAGKRWQLRLEDLRSEEQERARRQATIERLAREFPHLVKGLA